MKRFVIAMTLMFVLAITMLVQGQNDAGKWEYAKVTWNSFGAWSWNEPTLSAEGEELVDLFQELSIEIPVGKEADLYSIVNWAGKNGWELVTMEQRDRFVAGWFKRQ